MAVEVCWKKPSEPPTTWDDGKIKAANFNSRALSALYSGVTNEEFKKISSIEIAMAFFIKSQSKYSYFKGE